MSGVTGLPTNANTGSHFHHRCTSCFVGSVSANKSKDSWGSAARVQTGQVVSL